MLFDLVQDFFHQKSRTSDWTVLRRRLQGADTKRDPFCVSGVGDAVGEEEEGVARLQMKLRQGETALSLDAQRQAGLTS